MMGKGAQRALVGCWVVGAGVGDWRLSKGPTLFVIVCCLSFSLSSMLWSGTEWDAIFSNRAIGGVGRLDPGSFALMLSTSSRRTGGACVRCERVELKRR